MLYQRRRVWFFIALLVLIIQIWCESIPSTEAADTPTSSATAAAATLLEPDVEVADYKPPVELDVLGLFDAHNPKRPSIPAGANVPPPPFPPIQPVPPSTPTKSNPNSPPSRPVQPPPVPKSKSNGKKRTRKSASPIQPGQPIQPTTKSAVNKNPKKKVVKSGKSKKRTKSSGNRRKKNLKSRKDKINQKPQPLKPHSSAPVFDSGDIDPSLARHPPSRKIPTPFPQAGQPPLFSRPPPTIPTSAPSRPNLDEMTYSEIREHRARLYQEQKRRYNQLKSFHTAKENAEAEAEANKPPPTLEEMQAQLRAEGLGEHPFPSPFDAPEGGSIPPEMSDFGSPLQSTPIHLKPIPTQPKWLLEKKKTKKTRRRVIKEGMIGKLAQQQATGLSGRGQRVKSTLADMPQADDVTLNQVRSSLLSHLNSPATTQALRTELETLLLNEMSHLETEEEKMNFLTNLAATAKQAAAAKASSAATPKSSAASTTTATPSP